MDRQGPPLFAMPPRLRRAMLVAHVVSSVGWLGGVASFLVLSVTALRFSDPALVRSCYLAMDVMGRDFIVPMSLLAVITGLTQSLGTPWGLFRHYWVVTKLVISVLATMGLLVHQFTLVAAAAAAARAAAVELPDVMLDGFGFELVRDAALAIGVLLVATILSIFKPWGPIRNVNRAVKVIGWALAVLFVTVAVVHLLNAGHMRHG